jgi:hypothetical protein
LNLKLTGHLNKNCLAPDTAASLIKFPSIKK